MKRKCRQENTKERQENDRKTSAIKMENYIVIKLTQVEIEEWRSLKG